MYDWVIQEPNIHPYITPPTFSEDNPISTEKNTISSADTDLYKWIGPDNELKTTNCRKLYDLAMNQPGISVPYNSLTQHVSDTDEIPEPPRKSLQNVRDADEEFFKHPRYSGVKSSTDQKTDENASHHSRKSHRTNPSRRSSKKSRQPKKINPRNLRYPTMATSGNPDKDPDGDPSDSDSMDNRSSNTESEPDGNFRSPSTRMRSAYPPNPICTH